MSRFTPSQRWTSYEGWNYNGMKERLEGLIAKLDKKALLNHAELIKGQKFSMSEPFSAGQYWICFELVAEDDSLVIARVRLPRHPDIPQTVSEEDEEYSIACEVSAMRFVRQRLSNVVVPQVFAYEGTGSQLAANAGAIYMLIEGFRGNTLQDVVPDLCNLPISKLEHVLAQWTTMQTCLAAFTYPQIGSISGITITGEPIIDRLSSAAIEGLMSQGPFSNAIEYFTALGEAALYRASRAGKGRSEFHRLGASVFLDIVQSTTFFQESSAQYPLNHMDLGTQNIIVDEDLNFLAIIDWEFAQTAPWQINHYPMPFPLLWPDERIKMILDDPQHLAYKQISRQARTRELYCKKFREAEAKLAEKGVRLGNEFAEVLESPASRIYACFSKLGDAPEQDEAMVREMVRLAFNFAVEGANQYLEQMSNKMI
ncbi:phosphotransferase enzyme family domain-containing protein [Pochonia chlamydosporia 170]|uniref:Phosphotransferase enzyme family domain-containing protein n=1 Tax=Pochonia chlamydosporia 170 TaxID=1380566 RepID=A0A179FLH8_METCM|nr:phosphotransferase enzyme family domain-containing protein [Pochonia chlamydosporia 170]OAQ66198.1 phosphotransferase enzyme family domain-containing protein [Pochonia chlamydosporia 170]